MANHKVSPKKAIVAEQTEKERTYWINKFSGSFEKTILPYDFLKPGSGEGIKSYHYTFLPEISSLLLKLSNQSDPRLHIILVAGLHVLLYKYTGKEDLTISTPVYKQSKDGEYINTLLPLRMELRRDLSFKECILNARQVLIEATEHQNYPIELLPEQMKLATENESFALFEIAVLLENVQDVTYLQPVQHQLVFSFSRTEDIIHLSVTYNQGRYRKETIEAVVSHLDGLFSNALQDVHLPLESISILTKQEKEQLLFHFNNTHNVHLKHKTLTDLFEEQVEQNPDAVALVCDSTSYSYKELNKLSNQLAHYMRRQHHIKSDDPVGLMMEHSENMIIGILAVIKSGGAYIPIDPEFPEERIRYILADTSVKLIITSQKTENADWLSTSSYKTLELEEVWKEIMEEPKENPKRVNKAKDLAYVMYTSGSTGTPKGVMIEQRSVVRLVKETNYINITPTDRIMQAAPLAFDASTFEIWGALLNGAALYVAKKENVLDPVLFEEFLKRNRISIGWLTSSLFNSFVDQKPDMFATVNTLLVGGEALSPIHIAKALRANRELTLINGYGPTENTTFSACLKIDKEYQEAIPIGRPITNTRCYILNPLGELLPVGFPGELCVAGEGVARGYLNKPELTSEKFVEDPFVPGDKMYKTGDLARWLPDGTIEYLGRKDDQVKIRGHRIELKEIEHYLLKVENVKECVVLVTEDKETKEKYLVAYLVTDVANTIEELQDMLRKMLPEYMVPSYFVLLDKLPLTSNGKVDVRALPSPQAIEMTHIPPQNEVEEKLVTIWADVLGLDKEQIGTTTSFFLLGGHSLKAARMMSKVHKELDVKIPLKEIFGLTTIQQLSHYIQTNKTNQYQAIVKAQEKKFYPLSSAQKRLYVLQQMEPESTGYNLPSIVKLEGEVDKEKLEATFSKIIERHESLRTSFQLVLGQTFQKIHDKVDFNIVYDALEGGVDTPYVIRNFVKPFDLSQAPLFRVGLKKLNDKQHILMLDMHHIISDGISEDIFIKEFMALYAGENLPELKLQYRDFSEWKNSALQKDLIKQQESYWLKEFSDEIPVLQLPTDYARPAVQSFEGDAMYFHISKQEIAALKKMAVQEGATIYMVLLSLFNVLLSKLSRQDDILVGTPVAGRPHADLEQIIGVFVNTLVLRNYPREERKFKEFLQEVKKRTLDAFENQDYQFEDLVEKVVNNRDTSRNPLFSVMFNLHNIGTTQAEIPGLTLIPVKEESKVSKFDLSLDVVETADQLTFAFEYCTKLFKAKTIERFVNYFKAIVTAVTQNSEVRLADIDLLSKSEKELILHAFNNKVIDYPKDKTITALFEDQVSRTPEATAVVFEGKSLTYLELNEKANQIAHVLRKRGVSADTIVGLMLERSAELPVAIMGILKAGGAYLPIDSNYPEARKYYMLQDSKAGFLITQTHLLESNKELLHTISSENILCVDDEAWSVEDKQNPEHINKPEDLLYLIYTSGTTGDAKGIMIEHKNLVTYLFSFYEIFHQSAQDTVIQITSVSFDIFAEQLFGTLLKGGKLVIPTDEAIKDINSLALLINEQQVSMVSCPPLILNELNKLKPLTSVRVFINGGDVLKPEYVSNLIRYSKVYNGYGPAETTIGATHYQYTGDVSANIPIGPPMCNYRLYIVDGNQKLLPIGIPGELCISGNAVGRGYIGKAELTAEKFVPNPFEEGERMYKTGDLVRWLADGTIEFIGRIDKQVKIRGYRIETGEIESQLCKYAPIKEALVIAREDKTEKYLCAYYVADEEQEVHTLKEHLAKVLPQYMIPAFYIRIDFIPVTPNGKMNLKELPPPTLKAGIDYIKPRNEIEEQLVNIWAQVLEIEKDNISIDTDFFSIGGNSINATQLISKIQKEFAITMPLVEAFKAPNIMLQAAYIQSLALASVMEEGNRIVLLKKGENQQKHLFILHDGSGEVNGYIDFVNNLTTEYSCWGIKAVKLENLSPQNLKLEDIAASYIDKIKKIQPKGPYNLIGWSLGGTISFEMVRKLEEINEEIGFWAMFDSVAPPVDFERNGGAMEFNLETEIDWIQEHEFLKDTPLEGELRSIKEFDKIWPSIIQYIESSEQQADIMKKVRSENLVRVIPNYEKLEMKELFSHINLIRTLYNAHVFYQPSSKVKANIHYFKAADSDHPSIGYWSQFSEKTLKSYEVPGTHREMLKMPGASELVKQVEKSLQILEEEMSLATNE